MLFWLVGHRRWQCIKDKKYEAAPKVGASGNAGDLISANQRGHIRPHGGLLQQQ
jgi:hypothetical protein